MGSITRDAQIEKSLLQQVMVWCQVGAKPLADPDLSHNESNQHRHPRDGTSLWNDYPALILQSIFTDIVRATVPMNTLLVYFTQETL